MAGGDFVVAWQDDSNDNGTYEIRARGFRRDGSERFRELTVNARSGGGQVGPSIACNKDGFVVTWYDKRSHEIHARGLRYDGSEFIPQFKVNYLPLGRYGSHSRIAMNRDGVFAVTWTHDTDVRVRVFDPSGNAVVGESSPNYVDPWALDITGEWHNAPGSDQFDDPEVSIADDGRFAVTFMRRGDHGYSYMRFFRADGTIAVGSPFPVPLSLNPTSSRPIVRLQPDGSSFVIVENAMVSGRRRLFVHWYREDGTRLLTPIEVDTQGSWQIFPCLCLGFLQAVVAWQDDSDQNGYGNILARRISLLRSSPVAPIFTVNSDVSGQQAAPSIASDGLDMYVVAWEDDKDKNGYYEVMARAFNMRGDELFHDMTINTVSRGQQFYPDVAVERSECSIEYMMRGPGLETMRRFRESELTRSPSGQEIIRLLRDNSAELILVLAANPGLRKSAQALLHHFQGAANDGDEALATLTITSEMVREVRRLLVAFNAVDKSSRLSQGLGEVERLLPIFDQRTLVDAIRALETGRKDQDRH